MLYMWLGGCKRVSTLELLTYAKHAVYNKTQVEDVRRVAADWSIDGSKQVAQKHAVQTHQQV